MSDYYDPEKIFKMGKDREVCFFISERDAGRKAFEENELTTED